MVADGTSSAERIVYSDCIGRLCLDDDFWLDGILSQNPQLRKQSDAICFRFILLALCSTYAFSRALYSVTQAAALASMD